MLQRVAVDGFGLVDHGIVDRLQMPGLAKGHRVEQIGVANVRRHIAAVDHLLDLALKGT